jgi:hypothetical protein
MIAKFMPRAGILAALLCLASAAIVRADDVSVNAAVSDDETQAGQSVDFTITINGAADATVPPNIDVNGLSINYEGPSSQTQISFGTGFGSGSHFQQSEIHTYSVLPQQAGNFVIPAQQVVVNGRTYLTKPVNLKVDAPDAAGNGQGGGGGNGQLIYAEIVLPQDTAYIGEAVPMEVRVYYAVPETRVQLDEMPEITAAGCTVEKTTQPTETEVTRNGRQYSQITFHTAVTAAKDGKLTVGPVSVIAEAELPLRMPSGFPGNTFGGGIFPNMDPAFQMTGPPQQIKITGEPVTLTALPLPAEGQPPSFAGAVGSFTMNTTVSPQMVEAGDPVTVTAKIAGTGNFDRVTAPEITDPDGWRTYTPSAKFDGDDDVGISGTKTFGLAAIPETNKTVSPSLEWSYFDPVAQKYVTLTAPGVPIKVEGQIQQSAPPVVAQQGAQSSTPQPTPQGPDIAYIRADSTGWGATFEPLYTNRLFLAAQGAPLLALLAFAGIQVARKRAADERARLLAQLRREKETALATMRRTNVPESELYEAAARALRLEAAIQTGRAQDTLDGAEVVTARALDPELADRVRRVFDRQAEVLYAGVSGGRGPASAEARVDLLEIVKGYENAKPAE